MTRPLLRCTEISLRLTSRIAQSDCSFGWIACRRCLRGLRRFYSEPLRLPSPPLRLLLRWLSRSRPCCDLPAARLLPLIAGWQDRLANGTLVPESAPPCSVSVHLLPSHLDNGPGGALATCATFWSVCSQLRKLIGCRPRSPSRWLKSRPSCLQLSVLKRRLSRDMLCLISLVDWSDCCSRPALRLVHWLSRLDLLWNFAADLPVVTPTSCSSCR